MGVIGDLVGINGLGLFSQPERPTFQQQMSLDERAFQMCQQAYLGALDPMAYQNRQNAMSVMRRLQSMPCITQPKKPNPDRVAAIKELEESGIDVSEMSVYE
jgi:hypothetical protein